MPYMGGDDGDEAGCGGKDDVHDLPSCAFVDPVCLPRQDEQQVRALH